MSDLDIRTFGGLTITHHGAPVTGLASRKAEALLVYLACIQRPHTREALATLFWDERSQERALSNLSVLLTSLRHRLTPFLTITRQTIAFNLESDYWLDAAVLKAQLESPRHAQPLSRETITDLESALALYQGDFLAGFHVRACRDFEEWAVVERERLQRLAIEALETVVTFYLHTGNYPAGLAPAQRLLQLDPLREAAHHQVMLLLARSGQRSAALAQYEVCRRRLAEELGVAPSPNLTVLYERLRATQPIPPHNLSEHTLLAPFVGREDELAHIAERLANPDCRLLTLVGPGGSGKTRLALSAAAAHLNAFLHGIYVVPLASVSSSDFLIPALAQVLQFTFVGRANPKMQLFDYLHEKEMLLVLDNFEHLRSGADLLIELLRHAPEVKLLVTTRERLNLKAEWLLDIAGLEYPAGPEIENIEGYSATRLFTQMAQRVRADFQLSEDTRASVAHICRLVEGMPLAIELAAAWMRSFSGEHIAREIERNLDFLATSMRDVPEGHRSLRAVFEHSWGLLSQEEKCLLNRLSMFRGGFREEAARQVTEASPPHLAALLDKSFIRQTASGRYEIHELLRQYAEEKLRSLPHEVEATGKRHSAYYAEFVNRLETGLSTQAQRKTVDTLGEDIENVRQAWHWAVNQGDEEALQKSFKGLFRFYMIRSWFQEGEAIFGRASAQVGEAVSDEANHSLLLNGLLARQGVFCENLARYDQARVLLEKSLVCFRALGALDEIAFALSKLGILARNQGDQEAARTCFQESLEICQRLGDLGGTANALNNLGSVHYQWGDYELAQKQHQASLALYREIGDQQGASRCLMNLGNIAYRLGRYEEAQQLHQDSLIPCRAIHDLWGIAACLNNLGNALNELGDNLEAKHLYEESLAIKRELGHREGMASSLDNLGIVAARLKQYAEAQRLRQASLALRREIGYPWGIANSLNGLGDLACTLGQYPSAWSHYHEALKTALEIRAILLVEAALVGIAELLAKEGQRERALHALTLILDRPAQDKEIQDRADQLFTELRAGLPPEVVNSIREKARRQTLEEVATEWFTGPN